MDFLAIFGLACTFMVAAGACLMFVPIKTVWNFD